MHKFNVQAQYGLIATNSDEAYIAAKKLDKHNGLIIKVTKLKRHKFMLEEEEKVISLPDCKVELKKDKLLKKFVILLNK
jgi:hypothetical protein